MKNCLDEKTLLSVHDGDGSAEERDHVDSCLSCARRYRQLSDDLKDIVTALKQPPPRQAAHTPMVYTGMRLALAASLVGLAFLLGRMTTAGAFSGSFFRSTGQPAAQVASADQQYADVGDAAIASTYGMYVDGLIGQDAIGQEEDADANTVAVEDTWTNDSDGL